VVRIDPDLLRGLRGERGVGQLLQDRVRLLPQWCVYFRALRKKRNSKDLVVDVAIGGHLAML